MLFICLELFLLSTLLSFSLYMYELCPFGYSLLYYYFDVLPLFCKNYWSMSSRKIQSHPKLFLVPFNIFF